LILNDLTYALFEVKNPRPSKIPLFGEGRGSDLSLEGATKPPDPVSPVSAQHSTISYQIFKNMNRRTAEQGTAEYRSEKHCLIPFKNFCCSKFLVRPARHREPLRQGGRVFDIQNTKQAESRSKRD
jgi:hypothetical protein